MRGEYATIDEKAGSFNDKKAMIQSVLRDVASTNEWKKAGDISKTTGREFYDLV